MSKEASLLYRKKIRKEVLELYGHKCTCCNEHRHEFLAIDHINDDGNIERKKMFNNNHGSSSYSFYLKLKREPKRSDLQILCHNCNSSFAHYGYSPACPGCNRKTNLKSI